METRETEIKVVGSDGTHAVVVKRVRVLSVSTIDGKREVEGIPIYWLNGTKVLRSQGAVWIDPVTDIEFRAV